jgi:hypothetical protein
MGKLTTELRYQVKDRQLEAEHHIVLNQLEFGEATGSKDAVPLPVRLAVALLKDRNGVIDIELPVRGSLDDPSFRLAPIIWQAFVNLLTKVVTAPFAALGALFGGGEELAYVDFAAGSAELKASETAKLGKLASALAQRPQLKLDVPLALAETSDKQALARAALDQRVPPDAGDAAAAGKALRNRLRALESAYVALTNEVLRYPELAAAGKDEETAAKIEHLEKAMIERLMPDAAALEQLARNRARAVQAALLANPEVTAERIFITARRSTESSGPDTVRMELKLE